MILVSSNLYSKKLKVGVYRGVLFLNEEKGIELPFNFQVNYKGKKPFITIQNSDERIMVDEIQIHGDSVNFRMPIFDTEFRLIRKGNDLEGFWINHYKTSNNKIKFKASFGNSQRFETIPSKFSKPLFEGKWEVTFSPESNNLSKAIGIFKHVEQSDFVTGTFLTETGDYRYLEGIRDGNFLKLSCFDGSHAFLFIAEFKNDSLQNGKFYSGSSWQENWFAVRNPDFKLSDAEEITFLNNKNAVLNFSFPDLDSNMVSLSDKKFENKVLIIQLMGSWCPNCMDESRYFSELYNSYHNKGLEIIALAFEKTNDFNRSRTQIERMQKKLNIDYPILITQQTGKDKAKDVFDLNKVAAFPTTLFLNKQHQVVKIHSGFSGPATGEEFVIFKNRTENLINSLLHN